MSRKLLIFFLLVSLSTLSQDYEYNNLFSKAIGDNIRSYTSKSQLAYADKDFEKAEFLFDSLIEHVVKGSYLDNFKVRKISGRKIGLNDFEKPILLITYASWCTPGLGEIPALNDIADKHNNEIDFVILFWDAKDNIKKAAREYSKKISILYVDEKENTNDHIIESMKHSLGFPTTFFVDKDKRIIDVRRGVLHHFSEDYSNSFELNHANFLNGISLLKKLNDENEGLTLKEN